ncbi:LCP family protein [Paenibacillus solisilvae]|uniref:LCP family protein n=1 Tax=Paenibacillus solisilvae TaxID=2486751 RepID=A0ABW0W334_9BACL
MPRKQQKQTRRKRPWMWALLGVVVVAIAVVAVYFVNLNNSLGGLSKPKDESIFGKFDDKPAEKPAEWEGTERVNILIMGGDNRGLKKSETARSDSMLVASVDPVTKKAHLFSVLRDTYVPIEGHGEGRINTALALGGPNLAMKTIGGVLGLDIQYYVYTDFEGFKSLVDAIGGIQNFDVEKNMNYVDNADGNRYDIHLKKGIQDLDGTTALQYVRFRHDALSDFTRTERQRKLLTAVSDKMKSGWTVVKLNKIIDSISPYVETNIEVSDMLKLAQLGIGSTIGGSTQVPPMDLIGDKKVSGASVLSIRDDQELMDYVQSELAADNVAAAGSTNGTGTNGTGTNGANNAGNKDSANTKNSSAQTSD